MATKTLLNYESPLLLSRNSLCFNQIHGTKASLVHITMFGGGPRSPTSGINLSHSHRTQIQNFIWARKRKRKIGSARSTRLMLNLMGLIASNLKILPEPLDLVLEEIGGGDGSGGGLGFWKGFGWGGFDGGRRKRKRKLWLLYGFLMICGLGFLFGREIESNVVWWGLGFGPLGVALIQFWEKNGGIQAWVLGFCLWSFLVGLTFRREELQKWVGSFSFPSSMVESVRRQRRRRKPGRAF